GAGLLRQRGFWVQCAANARLRQGSTDRGQRLADRGSRHWIEPAADPGLRARGGRDRVLRGTRTSECAQRMVADSDGRDYVAAVAERPIVYLDRRSGGGIVHGAMAVVAVAGGGN